MAPGTKLCKGCNQTKAKSNFVNTHGHPNPRGKYCESCYRENERKHVMELMDGRDFCLYCGKQIEKYCEYDENGKKIRHYIEMDHMDPIALGGHDPNTCDINGVFEDGNTVYVCCECNQRKKDLPFHEWLQQLDDPFRELARAEYIKKNKKNPEDFEPAEDVVIEIGFEFDDLESQ